MSRKVLLSLIAASAGAGFAYADVTCPIGDWSLSGTGDGVDLSLLDQGRDVTVPNAINGYVFAKVTCNFTGTYRLSMGTASNATLSVIDAEATVQSDGSLEFQAVAGQEITIKISSTDGEHGYTFGNIVLVYVVDETVTREYAVINGTLTVVPNDLPELVDYYVNNKTAAERISADYTNLLKTYNSYKDALSTLADANADQTAYLEALEVFGLNGEKTNEKNAEEVNSKVNALIVDITNHNNEVVNLGIKEACDQFIAEFNTILGNAEKLYTTGVVGEGKNAKTVAKDDAQKAYANGELAGNNTAYATTLAAFQTQINDDFRDLSAEPEFTDFQEYAESITQKLDENEINFYVFSTETAAAYVVVYYNVITTLDNYNQWVEVEQPSLDNAYQKDLEALANLENNGNTDTNKAMLEINKIYDAAKKDCDALTGKFEEFANTSDPKKNADDAKGIIATAIDAMKVQVQNMQTAEENATQNGDELTEYFKGLGLQALLDVVDGEGILAPDEDGEYTIGGLLAEVTASEAKLDSASVASRPGLAKFLEDFKDEHYDVNPKYPAQLELAKQYQQDILGFPAIIQSAVEDFSINEGFDSLKAQMNQLKENIEALTTAVEDNIKAQDKYNECIKSVGSQYKKLYEAKADADTIQGKEPTYNIVKALENEYQNILDAILAVQNENYKQLGELNAAGIKKPGNNAYVAESVGLYTKNFNDANKLFNKTLTEALADTTADGEVMDAAEAFKNHVKSATILSKEFGRTDWLNVANAYLEDVNGFESAIEAAYAMLSTSFANGMEDANELANGPIVSGETDEEYGVTNGELVADGIKTSEGLFSVAVTTSNLDVLSAAKESAAKYVANLKGKNIPDLNILNAEYQDIVTSVNNLDATSESIVVDAAALDAQIATLYNKYSSVQDNYEYYTALVAGFNGLDTLLTKFQKAINSIDTEDTHYANEQDAWQDKYDGLEEAIKAAIAESKAAYAKIDLNTVPKGQEQTIGAALKAKVAAWNDEITVYIGNSEKTITSADNTAILLVSIALNESNFDLCQTEYTTTVKSVSTAISTLEEKCAEGLDLEVSISIPDYEIEFEGSVQDVIDELLTPLLGDAAKANKEAEKDFEALQLGTSHKKAVDDKFDLVEAKLKAILDALKSPYQTAVDNQNKKLAEELFGSLTLDELQSIYTMNVAKYNAFCSYNSGKYLPSDYKAAFQTLMDEENHIAIFYMAKPIYNLEAAINSLLKEAVPFGEDSTAELLTAEDFNKVEITFYKRNADGEYEETSEGLIDAYASILGEMSWYGMNLQKDVEEFCQEWYTNAVLAAKDLVDYKVATLSGDSAQVPETYYESEKEEAQEAIDEAETIYNDVHNPAAPEDEDGVPATPEYVDGDIAKSMNEIYMNLYNADQAFNMETVSAKAWAGEYAPVAEEFKNWYYGFEDEEGNIVESIRDFADSNAQILAFMKLYANLHTLSDFANVHINAGTMTEVYPYNNKLLNIGYALSTLSSYEAKGKALYNEAQANNENAQAINDQKATWQEEVSNLRDEFAELRQTLGSLDVVLTGIETSSISAGLNQLDSEIASYTGQESQKDSIEALLASIEEGINNAYSQALLNQRSTINGMLDQLMADYNNKRAQLEAEGKSIDEIAGYLSSIEEQRIALATVIADYNIRKIDAKTAVDELKTIQDNVTALLEENVAEYQKPTTAEENKQAAIEALNLNADDAQAAIDAASAQLAESENIQLDETVKANVQGQIDALQQALDQIKDTYTAEGEPVVDQVAYFKGLIANVKSSAVALTNSIAAQEQVMAISNANYERLLGEYNELKDTFDAVVAAMNAYQCKSVEENDPAFRVINAIKRNISGQLQSVLNDLEKRRAEYSLLPTVGEDNEEVLPVLANNTIASSTQVMAEKAAAMEINYMVNTVAKDAVDALRSELISYSHINQGSLISQYNALFNRLNALITVSSGSNDPNQANPDYTYTEEGNPDVVCYSYVKRAQDIADAANGVLAEAEAYRKLMGDANEDNKVTWADYDAMLQLIMSGAQIYDEDGNINKGAYQSDLNGNGRLDMADLMQLVNLLSGYTSNQASMMAAMPTDAINSTIRVNTISQNGSTRLLAIELTSGVQFGGVQFDIMLPEGMKIVREYIAEGASALNFHSGDLANGAHRIGLASASKETIAAGTSNVVYIEVEGYGSIGVDNAYGATTQGQGFNIAVEGGNTTGVTTITDDLKNGARRIYNMGGQMLQRMQRGFNIIRNADGTTTKVRNQE